jgi:hypothetical protein
MGRCVISAEISDENRDSDGMGSFELVDDFVVKMQTNTVQILVHLSTSFSWHGRWGLGVLE